MRTLLLIPTSYQETNTIRTTAITLGVDLGLVGDLPDEPANGERAVVDKGVVEALSPHVLAEDSGVGGEARDGNAHVGVDLEDLLLEGRQLGGVPLDDCHHRVRLALQPHTAAPLLHRLHRVLYLEQPPLRRPRRGISVIMITIHSLFFLFFLCSFFPLYFPFCRVVFVAKSVCVFLVRGPKEIGWGNEN